MSGHDTIAEAKFMNTLGIYVAIPFCRSKCTYCNFASGVYPEHYHERYVERIAADISKLRRWAELQGALFPEIVDSIYFGGGTPSLLSPQLIQRLFVSLRSEFTVLPTAEITMEAAPGQLEPASLDAALEGGTNRFSFGVQSFIDREAAVSGRLHNRETAKRDIERIRQKGVTSFNVDLIAGLAHQTMDSWKESLAALVETEAPHASVYMLEVDEDSRLGREVLSLGSRYHAGAVPEDDLVADMYSVAIEILEGNGIPQYEISNFARPGFESLHNRKYWERRPYLGLGVDASSMLRGQSGEILRFSLTEDLDRYLSGAEEPELQRLDTVAQLEEAWFLGLRLREGLDQESLLSEFGLDAVTPTLRIAEELAAEDFLQKSGNRWSLSAKGKLLSNEVFQRFIDVEEDAASGAFPSIR